MNTTETPTRNEAAPEIRAHQGWPLHPPSLNPDRYSANVEHHSSAKPPDPNTPAPPFSTRSGSRKKTPIGSTSVTYHKPDPSTPAAPDATGSRSKEAPAARKHPNSAPSITHTGEGRKGRSGEKSLNTHTSQVASDQQEQEESKEKKWRFRQRLSSQRRRIYPKESCFYALVSSKKEREEKKFSVIDS
ncbi:hypothetical protein ACOSQ3_003659 [Xanthoceras sorbifolium]